MTDNKKLWAVVEFDVSAVIGLYMGTEDELQKFLIQHIIENTYGITSDRITFRVYDSAGGVAVHVQWTSNAKFNTNVFYYIATTVQVLSEMGVVYTEDDE